MVHRAERPLRWRSWGAIAGAGVFTATTGVALAAPGVVVAAAAAAGGGTQPIIRFGTLASNSNTLGRIVFVYIPSYGGGFVVETNSSGAATDTTTEKFRIDKDFLFLIILSSFH